MGSHTTFTIRAANQEEHRLVGQLLVSVYAQIPGFPDRNTQPQYYHLLEHIGTKTEQPGTEILVAVTPSNELWGAVVYFGDMQYYGSGGSATQEQDAAGFRLLAVANAARGQGVGLALSEACIQKARTQSRKRVVIHTTKAMPVAWSMYKKMGFQRSPDLDFMQEDLEVFGFRLELVKP